MSYMQQIHDWINKPVNELPINLFYSESESRCKQLLKACIIQLLCKRLDRPELFETTKKLNLFGIDDINGLFTKEETNWIIKECDSREYIQLGCELIMRGLTPKFEVLSKCKHFSDFYTVMVLTQEPPETEPFSQDEFDDYCTGRDLEHTGRDILERTSIGTDRNIVSDLPGVPTINNIKAPALKVYKPEKSQQELMEDPRTKIIDSVIEM